MPRWLQFKAIRSMSAAQNVQVWHLLRDNIRVSDLVAAIWRRRLPRPHRTERLEGWLSIRS